MLNTVLPQWISPNQSLDLNVFKMRFLEIQNQGTISKSSSVDGLWQAIGCSRVNNLKENNFNYMYERQNNNF